MKRQWQDQLQKSVVSEDYKGRSWCTAYWQEERIKVNTLEACLLQIFNLFPAGLGEVTTASESLANRLTKLRGCVHQLCVVCVVILWIMGQPFARHSKHLWADWLINSWASPHHPPSIVRSVVKQEQAAWFALWKWPTGNPTTKALCPLFLKKKKL